MPKLKLTKTELKSQREALKRFTRYLPTLLLKKAQLQAELRQVEQRIEEKRLEERRMKDGLAAWVKLFAEPFDFGTHLRVASVVRGTTVVAGVAVPTLADVVLERKVPDLLATAPWVDEGLLVVEQVLRLRLELAVLLEQQQKIAAELRVTSQRVNLFEKVKIPECKQNIRRIRTALGDQQTLGVARGKLAKGRIAEKVVGS